ncbi:hypothetical protein B0H19DRAFT_718759 [Mycena capillaripes]|nr:hypothetical protein B0H19DRAFT_718759 [Mycena capillaripes]
MPSATRVDHAVEHNVGSFLCFSCISRRRPPAKNPPTYPPPLPSVRLDIRKCPPSQQPAECTLLHLPLELRQCIYEQALGGRLISLKLVASRTHGHTIVRSTYYKLPDDLHSASILVGSSPAADRISTALLLSCRQVYLEALPIMHRRNTFHFLAHELEIIVLSALGGYCLSNIRSVCLRHHYRTMNAAPWAMVFQLLHQMQLRELAFEFDFQLLEWSEITPQRDVLNTDWGRRVLGMRNLREFGLFFTNGDPPEYPVYRTNIAERLRQLIIGSEADERYKCFLQDRG